MNLRKDMRKIGFLRRGGGGGWLINAYIDVTIVVARLTSKAASPRRRSMWSEIEIE